MSVLGRLEALRDIQREGSVDYETLNLAISQITTLTQERDAARAVIEKVWNVVGTYSCQDMGTFTANQIKTILREAGYGNKREE